MNDLYFALSAGVLGSFGHCIGMCGPIVTACALKEAQGAPHHLLYNLGRIITYSALGAAMGTAGSFVSVAARIEGVQNAAMALAGVLMIVLGLSVAGSLGGLMGWLESRNLGVLRLAQGFIRSSGALRYLPLGLVMGLLPCGLSYTMLIAAAGSGGAEGGALLMAAFGLGTAPAMLLVGLAAGKIGPRLRGALYRMGGALVALMGAYYLYKSVGLYASM